MRYAVYGRWSNSFRLGKKANLDIWSLQLEINCGITNNPQNFDKYLRLLEVLKSWLEDIESKQNHSD